MLLWFSPLEVFCSSPICVRAMHVWFLSTELNYPMAKGSPEVQFFLLQEVVYSLEKLFDSDSFQSLLRIDWKGSQIWDCILCEDLSWLLSCLVHCSSKILFWFSLGILFCVQTLHIVSVSTALLQLFSGPHSSTS